MVVAEKKNRNYAMPLPMIAEFERLAEGLGGKQKWIALSAAVLMFSSASPEEKEAYMIASRSSWNMLSDRAKP